MTTKELVHAKIKDLNNGKVVRIFKDGWNYKIAKMDTMAAIIITPVNPVDKTELLLQIQTTGYCTMTQAEMLIEHICN